MPGSTQYQQQQQQQKQTDRQNIAPSQTSIGLGILGTTIDTVVPFGPSDMSASLMAGDVILEIDGTAVNENNIGALLIGDDEAGSLVCVTARSSSGDIRKHEVFRQLRTELISATSTYQLIEMIKADIHGNATSVAALEQLSNLLKTIYVQKYQEIASLRKLVAQKRSAGGVQMDGRMGLELQESERQRMHNEIHDLQQQVVKDLERASKERQRQIQKENELENAKTKMALLERAADKYQVSLPCFILPVLVRSESNAPSFVYHFPLFPFLVFNFDDSRSFYYAYVAFLLFNMTLFRRNYYK
jgi:hypothetical protein